MTLIDKAEVLMLENEFSKIYIRVYQGNGIKILLHWYPNHRIPKLGEIALIAFVWYKISYV